jgi:predicted GNAT family N-acyltransferase
MISLKHDLIPHREISEEFLGQIVRLKSQHWNYTNEQHLDWIKKNIQRDDFHLVVENGEKKVIAYLNLVKILISFDNKNEEEYLGIGNVCVDHLFVGTGLGLLIMNTTNFYLKYLGKRGSLICKPNLNAFYSKANWIKFNGEFVIGNNLGTSSLYFSNEIDASLARINKNF